MGFFVQDKSALYILCGLTSAANTMICKAKLTFSLFQGPSENEYFNEFEVLKRESGLFFSVVLLGDTRRNSFLLLF